MKAADVSYEIKTASAKNILLHLIECSDSFVPPLAERVNINEYAKKIFKKSVTFEAWADQVLVGLLAAYFNNFNNVVFITNVSLLGNFVGYGIASNLLEMCIKYARENNFREILLEVHKDNSAAFSLYKKYRFAVYGTKKNELLMKRQM